MREFEDLAFLEADVGFEQGPETLDRRGRRRFLGGQRTKRGVFFTQSFDHGGFPRRFESRNQVSFLDPEVGFEAIRKGLADVGPSGRDIPGRVRIRTRSAATRENQRVVVIVGQWDELVGALHQAAAPQMNMATSASMLMPKDTERASGMLA